MKDLPLIAQKFVLHWGEMGTRWGINRTVAQVHALLFLSENPLPADEIAETLGVARSNISTSLRELQNWGIVRIVHVIGDLRTGENFHATNASLVEHDSNLKLQGYEYAELASLVRYRHQPGNAGILFGGGSAEPKLHCGGSS